MRTVRVAREVFLATVKENRDNHRAVFEEALDGYRRRLIRELERRINDVKRGRPVDFGIRLPEPEDHTEDYDRVISMAELSLDDEVSLDEHDFGKYMMDQWPWKHEFAETTGLYVGARR